MLFPKKTKFKKQFKQIIKNTIKKEDKIIFGEFAIKSIENGVLTYKQIEAVRKNIVKKMKRLGYLWIRVFPHKIITKKPTENRMGKGKGSFFSWVSPIKKGQIIFEISGLPGDFSKKILKTSCYKLPLKTTFVFK